MAETTIQVGEGGKKPKGPRWRPVLIFVAVIIAAGGAGVGLRWLQQYREYKLATKPTAIQAKTDEAQKIALTGDYDKAHQTIDKALENPELSPDGKYDLLFQKAVTYENEKAYDTAISVYKQAEAVKQTQAVAEAIARVAETKGDKTQAIEYYKKALARISKTNNPLAEATAEYYNQRIAALGGAP